MSEGLAAELKPLGIWKLIVEAALSVRAFDFSPKGVDLTTGACKDTTWTRSPRNDVSEADQPGDPGKAATC